MPGPASAIVQELAVLRVLGSLGCATMQHLHRLCFPAIHDSTMRTRLRGLIDASWITRTAWHVPRTARTRGQVWTLTRGGCALLHRFDPKPCPHSMADLRRPRTALEFEEWMTRLDVRTLIVRLICAARSRPLLAHVRVQVPPVWPTPGAVAHRPTPDAELQIAWDAPIQQPGDWLPWPARCDGAPVQSYAVYLDRSSFGSVAATLERWMAALPPAGARLLAVWLSDARLEEACRRVQAVPAMVALRMTSWARVEEGADGAQWRDANGHACALALRADEQIQVYHAVATA